MKPPTRAQFDHVELGDVDFAAATLSYQPFSITRHPQARTGDYPRTECHWPVKKWLMNCLTRDAALAKFAVRRHTPPNTYTSSAGIRTRRRYWQEQEPGAWWGALSECDGTHWQKPLMWRARKTLLTVAYVFHQRARMYVLAVICRAQRLNQALLVFTMMATNLSLPLPNTLPNRRTWKLAVL